VLHEPSVEAIVPYETLVDFVTYASQLSTITVLSERFEVDVNQSGGDGRARLVTITIDENLWIEPHVVGDAASIAPEGARLEFVTWGPGEGESDSSMGGFGGEPLLRVGCRHLVGLVRDGDALIPYPGSVGVLDGDEVHFGSGGLLNLPLDDSAPSTGAVAISEVVRAVGAARPDDRIDDTGLTEEEFFVLDAWGRSLAIARSTTPVSLSPSSLPVDDDGGASPVITAFPSDAIEEGIVYGTLTESDGCLYVADDGSISLLVLPAGTRWDPSVGV
jgi:hypothetical protein